MENERWKDPKSWDCLDDAQRETIKNWYEEVLENNKKNSQKKRPFVEYSTLFGIIPLAVALCLSNENVSKRAPKK